MKLGALTLFDRWTNRGGIDLAAWHSPHSMTWQWMVSLDWLTIHPRWGFFRDGLGEVRQRIVRMGPLTVTWHTQPVMWFCDLYWHAIKERDDLAKGIAGLELQLAESLDRICALVEANSEVHADLQETIARNKPPCGIKMVGQFWKQ